MICPQCQAEYRPGFSVCMDCDVELVESLADVRVETRLEPFHRTTNPDELAVLLEALEELRVPYVVQAGTALSLAAGGDLDDGEQPDPWEARIAVLASGLPQARELLARLRDAARRGTPLD